MEGTEAFDWVTWECKPECLRWATSSVSCEAQPAELRSCWHPCGATRAIARTSEPAASITITRFRWARIIQPHSA